MPARPQAYHIKVEASAPGARADAISAVRSALLSNGWRESNDADSWSVEVTYSFRPMVVGAYSDESARKEMWVLPPSVPYFWTRERDAHVLTLTLARPQDDSHDISVGAAMRTGDPAQQSVLQALARTAVSRLDGAAMNSAARPEEASGRTRRRGP